MLSRLNPLTKLIIVCVFTVAAVWTLDLNILLALLLLELIFLPFLGLSPKKIAWLIAPLLAVAAIVVLTNALFSGIVPEEGSGSWEWAWGPFTLSPDSLAATLPIGLRILVLSIPAVLMLGTTDPTDLADSLMQHLKVPARYALSMVVGLRLTPQLRADWTEQSAAMRARGVDTKSPWTAIKLAPGRLVNLLVFGLRRATRSATTMNAKGFDPYAPRTLARESVLRVSDFVAVVLAIAVVVAIMIYMPTALPAS